MSNMTNRKTKQANKQTGTAQIDANKELTLLSETSESLLHRADLFEEHAQVLGQS